MSRFSYCPLTWMLHSGNMQYRINRIYKMALKLAYNDTPNLSFDKLFIKDKSVGIHQINLHLLSATEIFKAKNGIAPELMSNICQFGKKPYDLRNARILNRKRIKTVHNGSDTHSSLAPKVWKLTEKSLKEKMSVTKLKNKIKIWATTNVRVDSVRNT